MAGFTTIAAATISIGGSVAKGALAGDAAKTAAREAGRFKLEQQRLEKESVARLEQNFYDAVRATTDVYDKQLERGNVMGAQILESVQEGDQRGVAAAAGKVKQVQDATLSDTADKFAKQKLDIDMARAKAGEMSASEIAAFQDDRAAAAGLKADALEAQADQSLKDAKVSKKIPVLVFSKNFDNDYACIEKYFFKKLELKKKIRNYLRNKNLIFFLLDDLLKVSFEDVLKKI